MKEPNAEPQEESAPPLKTPLPSEGSDATTRIRQFFPSGQTEAKAAATARADRMGRMTGQLDIVIVGDPSVFAQAPLQVVNVDPAVDGEWSITSVTHIIDEAGYETHIHAEYPETGAGATSHPSTYVPTPPG